VPLVVRAETGLRTLRVPCESESVVSTGSVPPSTADQSRPFDPDRDQPPAAHGHHDLVAQPHREDQEGPIAEAEAQAAVSSTDAQPLGLPGRPVDRRSPFLIGMTATAGVAVTVLLADLVITARDVLVLIGLALFIAVGLEPAVSWLARHRMPRWAAVITVFVVLFGAAAGLLTVAIPQLVAQTEAFIAQVPGYLHDLQDSSTILGGLNSRFHIQDGVNQLLSSGGSNLFGGLLGAGAAVLNAASSTLIVVVLIVYFLADLPRIRRGIYRLAPNSRRPRTILIGDEIFAKVGAYVLGNVTISLIAGALALAWMVILGIPFSLLLAVLVALLDVVPVIGTAIAGAAVTLVALTVSGPVALATAAFFVVYRVVEDYLLVPRIIGRAVKVPGLLTIIAVLIGGVLLGVIGAIVAIPIAAAVLLLVEEVLIPRLDLA
jgi:predicted PurR-regulated permease PerM